MPKKNFKLTNILYGIAFFTSATYIPFSENLYAASDVETLSDVKSEISRQEHLLSTRSKKLTELQSELKNQEQTISKLVSDIRDLSTTLNGMDENIDELKFTNQQLEVRKKTQVKQLKELLDSQYRQGKNGSINAILSGKGADLERMTIYAERLSKARSEIIGELEATSAELQFQQRVLDEQREQQLTVLNKLNNDKEKLETTQKARQETTEKIQQQIKNSKIYLAELKENERRLSHALQVAKKAQAERDAQETRLAKLKAEQDALKEKQQVIAQEKEPEKQQENSNNVPYALDMKGIGASRGKLNWPVKGRLLHTFGSQQSGQLRWQGVVISAKAGSEVEAIHDGTVVLSNWLRGYGLMLVIDHGKGDMSFYGYNQTLLRKVGDKVRAGETIALVGNSGGQTSSGLYFEIRRKGDAINPSPWLRR